MKMREYLRGEIADILIERLSQSLEQSFETVSGRDILQQLLERKIHPYQAAEMISRGSGA